MSTDKQYYDAIVAGLTGFDRFVTGKIARKKMAN